MRRSGTRQSDAIARGRRSQCSTQRACAGHCTRPGPTGCVGTRCYNFPPALPKKRLPVLKLIASKTSPYVRKVRIALAEKKIEYECCEVSPGDPGNPVHECNPLGKVPVLVLDDGTACSILA